MFPHISVNSTMFELCQSMTVTRGLFQECLTHVPLVFHVQETPNWTNGTGYHTLVVPTRNNMPQGHTQHQDVQRHDAEQ